MQIPVNTTTTIRSCRVGLKLWPDNVNWNSCIYLGGKRHCKSKVFCPGTQLSAPARARTRTARSETLGLLPPTRQRIFSYLCHVKLTCGSTWIVFISTRWQSRTCKSATHPFTHANTTFKKEFFLSRFYIILVDLCTSSSTHHSTPVWLDTSAHASFLMGCMCMLVHLVGMCTLPLLSGLHYLVVIYIFTFLVSNYAHFVCDWV